MGYDRVVTVCGFPRFAGKSGGGGNRTRVGVTPETVALQELRWACDDAYRSEQQFLIDLAESAHATRELLQAGPETGIYAVCDDQAVKIGTASNAIVRAAQLQVGSSRQLILAAAAPGTFALEMWLHDRLGEWRLRGEWFELSRPVLAVLGMLMSAAEQCETMEETDCGPVCAEDTVSVLAWDSHRWQAAA